MKVGHTGLMVEKGDSTLAQISLVEKYYQSEYIYMGSMCFIALLEYDSIRNHIRSRAWIRQSPKATSLNRVAIVVLVLSPHIEH